nr:NAD(P)/FAD-dependent oxidoreductase [Marinigracilibium pacificum]
MIIGAGPAGLAVGSLLKQAGIPFVMIEKNQSVGSSWKNHYDRLRLHTSKKYSHLPGLPFPEAYPDYVPREDFSDYLDIYATRYGIKPEFGQEVIRVVRSEDDLFVTESNSGKVWISKSVIVCTGFNRKPICPKPDGFDVFKGTQIHSSSYHNGEMFRGQNVMVVGMGNTGAEIAMDLSDHDATTYLSVRSPVNVVPLEFRGRPTQHTSIVLNKYLPPFIVDFIGNLIKKSLYNDMGNYGLSLEKEPPGKMLRKKGKTPVIDQGTMDYIREGKIEVKPALTKVREHWAWFDDESMIDIDAIIYATGFRSAIEEFIEGGDKLLNQYGHPYTAIPGDRYPGMYFLGFNAYKSGILYSIQKESPKIVDHLKKYLRQF